MSILKLDNETMSINVCEMILTNWDLLKVIEKKEKDSGNLLPTEVIKDLSDLLYEAKCVIFKVFVTEFMITQYPEQADNVISNLWLLSAVSIKQKCNHVKWLSTCTVDTSKFILLHES